MRIPRPIPRLAAPALALALGAATASAFGPGPVLYADRAGTDVVLDAPWRTMRDHVPVLVFLPQFRGGRRVECVRVSVCEDGVPLAPPVVADHAGGPDTLNGATFVGPLGEARGGLEAGERVGDFWHYVVRVPLAALGAHGAPGVCFLRAEVEWTRPGPLGRSRFTTSRVLRVRIDRAPLPGLDSADCWIDPHVHTLAEQSTSGPLDVDGTHKAYGGPLVMLLESAYALGLVDTAPADGNWDAFRDRVAVTDHNVFYSTRPYETGSRPGAGPTAALSDGHAAEAAWYRAHLGTLAGEEITLRRGPGQDRSLVPNLGHHLLAFGAPHFEGPWHGGLFLTSRLENPNTLAAVLAGTRATAGGFLYASHPGLDGFVWPRAYWDEALGWPPFDARDGAAVDAAGTDFVFKGAEVWNIKADESARDSGRLPASSAFDRMDPFAGGPAAQRFGRVAWDDELRRSLDTLLVHVGRGLRHAFRESPEAVFIRKLYLCGGSDAHGDFDYTDEVTATVAPYSGFLTSNAFARVRTGLLVHERAPGARDAVDAFRDGNAVASDGPLVSFAIDADGRHDPAAGAARWHDAAPGWRDADGRIGGSGVFDGGGTALVPRPGDGAWVRTRWRRSVTPGAADVARLRFDRVTANGRDTFAVGTGPEGPPDDRPLPVALDATAALLATARDAGIDERCITNPVWVAPVGIDVSARDGVAATATSCAFAPGDLRVTFDFPFSMSPAGARAFLRPLDGNGESTDPEIALVPAPGWERRDGVAGARLTVTNRDSVAVPPGAWDATTHAPAAGARSFVVYLTRPADVHGNVLNDIGRAFAVRLPGPPRHGAEDPAEPPGRGPADKERER